MKRKGSLFYFLAGVLALVFFIGCGETPPSIEFDIPDGQVILIDDPESVQMVTISGKVTEGTSTVNILKANGQDITPDSEGNFTYDFNVNSSSHDIFSSCEFLIGTETGVRNRERITFIKGTPGYPMQNDTVNNAVNVRLNEEMVNYATQGVQNVINESFQELIDDMAVFPMKQDLGVLGQISLDKVEISDIAIGHIDIENGDWLKANNIEIDAFVIKGTYATWDPLGWIPDIPFTINVGDIVIAEMDVTVFLKTASNNVCLRLDADDLDDNFWDSLNISGNFGILNIPSGFIDLFMGLIGDFFQLLFNTIAIPLIDADQLAMSIDISDLVMYNLSINMELDMSIWFPLASGPDPEEPIYTTNAYEEMYLELGVAMAPLSGFEPQLEPFQYLATNASGGGEEELPPVELVEDFGENHNLVVGVNDDTVNMAAAAGVRAGVADRLDITWQFGYLAGSFLKNTLFKNTKVYATLKTPPVADLSNPAGGSGMTTYTVDPDTEVISYAGKYQVSNMIIEIENMMASDDRIRVSVDTDVAVNLRMSDDGKHIDAFLDKDETTLKINYLYYSNVQLPLNAGFQALIKDITLTVMDKIVGALMDLKVPAIELYGANLQPHLYSLEVGDNNMRVRLGVSEFVPEP